MVTITGLKTNRELNNKEAIVLNQRDGDFNWFDNFRQKICLKGEEKRILFIKEHHLRRKGKILPPNTIIHLPKVVTTPPKDLQHNTAYNTNSNNRVYNIREHWAKNRKKDEKGGG
jgi:hypothetical protein